MIKQQALRWVVPALFPVVLAVLGALNVISSSIFDVLFRYSFLPLLIPGIPWIVTEVLKSAKMVKFGGAELRANDQIVAKVDDIGEKVELLASKFASVEEQGTLFDEHGKAFDDAFERVGAILKGDPMAEIELRLLVVSMRYSLDYLERRSVKLVEDFRKSRIEWKICMTSPDYLAGFDIRRDSTCDWEQLGRTAIRKLEEMKSKIQSKDLPSTLSIDYSLYESIPQWHGLLIYYKGQARHLYLGTSDWTIEPPPPILTVGSNQYRYFNLDTSAGRRHISQFRHWFTIYRRWDSLKKGSK